MAAHDTAVLPSYVVPTAASTQPRAQGNTNRGDEVVDQWTRSFLARFKGYPHTLAGARPANPEPYHIRRAVAPVFNSALATSTPAEYEIWNTTAWVDLTFAEIAKAMVHYGAGSLTSLATTANTAAATAQSTATAAQSTAAAAQTAAANAQTAATANAVAIAALKPARAYVSFAGATGVMESGAHNVTAVTRASTGVYVVTGTFPADAKVGITCQVAANQYAIGTVTARSLSSVTVVVGYVGTLAGALYASDPLTVMVTVHG